MHRGNGGGERREMKWRLHTGKEARGLLREGGKGVGRVQSGERGGEMRERKDGVEITTSKGARGLWREGGREGGRERRSRKGGWE